MIPARSCNMSRAELADGSWELAVASLGDAPVGEGLEEGMVCATSRKNWSMYSRDLGSYCNVLISAMKAGDAIARTYVYGIYVAFMERVHVSIW